MFRLAVPKGVHDNRVLDYLKNIKELQETEHFNRESDDEGLVHYTFPNMGEDNFKYIVSQLKNQGVTMIGVDTQLTERKIMKLADLIKEAPNLDEEKKSKWLQALKNILQVWQTKQYADDKSKWEEYYLDIEDLVKSWDEEVEGDSDPYSHDQQSPNTQVTHATMNVNESKLRSLIRKTIRQ
jgi:tripartite-type tricarboxylate transporter receptor subunit TctC